MNDIFVMLTFVASVLVEFTMTQPYDWCRDEAAPHATPMRQALVQLSGALKGSRFQQSVWKSGATHSAQ